MSILSFVLILGVAVVCAFLAQQLVPNTVPGGFMTSAIVGTIGAWSGGSLLGHFGPDILGVSMINCVLGSAILVFILAFMSRSFKWNVST